jgi:hypothetical protein
MTSKICISNIKRCTIKGPAEIPESKRREGRVAAGSLVNRIQPGQTIDVIVLMKTPILICDTEIEFYEDDVRKRQTYKYDDISDNSFKNQRLAVGTEFFKDVKQTDAIYLILH